MRAMSLVMAAGLAVGCLSAADLKSPLVRAREEQPPPLIVRIDGRRVTGSGDLRVAPAPAALKGRADLMFLSDKQQRIEIRGTGALLPATFAERLGVPAQPSLRLRYEQRIGPDARRVFIALTSLTDRQPALLVHLDLGGKEPIRKEILPGLTLAQRDEPRSTPDVKGASARRTWLTVEVLGAEPAVKLEGGETRTISFRGASYQLHVYRSLRRDPGTNPRLPFEGEQYLLTATLTQQ